MSLIADDLTSSLWCQHFFPNRYSELSLISSAIINKFWCWKLTIGKQILKRFNAFKSQILLFLLFVSTIQPSLPLKHHPHFVALRHRKTFLVRGILCYTKTKTNYAPHYELRYNILTLPEFVEIRHVVFQWFFQTRLHTR